MLCDFYYALRYHMHNDILYFLLFFQSKLNTFITYLLKKLLFYNDYFLCFEIKILNLQKYLTTNYCTSQYNIFKCDIFFLR